MKFQYLREFHEAAQADELQAAARSLGISLSVLSKHISSLETELGVELFTRSGRRAKLTEYGKILASYAQPLAQIESDCLEALRAPAPSPTRSLVIGMSPIQFREKARILIDEFGSNAENIRVRLATADNRELPELVAQGDLDLAIVRTPCTVERRPELVYLPFYTDTMVAVLPESHPLAKEKFLTFAQLKDENVVLRKEKGLVATLCAQGYREAGVEKEFRYVSHYGTYDTVRSGEAITFFLTKPNFTNSGPALAVVPVRPAVTTFVDIVFRRGNQSGAVREFLQHAISACF
ncbi:MAG: LysR family transcriptional regulator [Firmicutes bacterium]|nr:LysR family transcriptional regulator [Bacillota bacterium]